jgi:ribosomal protein S18 acetylase RimI-like enzyme
MADKVEIRRARPEEAPHLTEVALRSKASWGYDPALLEALADQLEIRAEESDRAPTFVLEADGVVVGLYRLGGDPPEGFLTDLWLEPDFQGRGFGRRLWEHALAAAAALGYRSLLLEADPNAEGFYAAMGAVRVGERESPLVQKVEPGRVLPLMRFELDA